MSENNGKNTPNIHTLAIVIRRNPDTGDLAIDPKIMVSEKPNQYVAWVLNVVRDHTTRTILWLLEGLASKDPVMRKEAWAAARAAVKDNGTPEAESLVAYGDIMCSFDGKGDQGSTIIEVGPHE